MAILIPVAGPQLIRVNTGTAKALEDLGYTEGGFEFEEEEVYQPVFGDQLGGPGGIPIDFQRFGVIARARIVLTRVEMSVWNKLTQGMNAPSSPRTAGTTAVADRGALMFQGGFSYAVRAVGTSEYHEFAQCLLRARTKAMGTPAEKNILTFEAFPQLSDGLTWSKASNA